MVLCGFILKAERRCSRNTAESLVLVHVCRTSRVRVPPEAALLFLLRKRELSSGVVALLCLVAMTDRSCMSRGETTIPGWMQKL